MKRFIEDSNDNENIKSLEGLLAQNVVAVSKKFAKILPKWSQIEVKLFFAIIERINWRQGNNGNVVVLKNEDLLMRLDWNESASLRQFSNYILGTLENMMHTSLLKVDGIDENPDQKERGYMIYHVRGTLEQTEVVLNESFMPLFENLIKTKDYFTYWIEDIYTLRSKHAQNLYFELIEKSKTFGAKIEEVDFTTRQLKNVFKLSKEAYMDDKGFRRSKFEQRTLDKAVEEILKSKLIELIPYEDGKYYTKTKKGRNVDKYKFKYRVRDEVLKDIHGSYWYDKEAFSVQRELNRQAKMSLIEAGILTAS